MGIIQDQYNGRSALLAEVSILSIMYQTNIFRINQQMAVFYTQPYVMALTILLIVSGSSGLSQSATVVQTDQTEVLKKSLVYIEASVYSYSAFYPWRHTDLSKRVGYGCAVGAYQVLTTAYNVADASFITVRRFGRNELIPASLKVIDYESNLCLLELDQARTGTPLLPIIFHDQYEKGDPVEFYRLSRDSRVESGRGYMDRVELYRSSLSYTSFINFIIGNVSQRAGLAHLFFQAGKAVGLGCWYDKSIKEAGLIPAEVINQFLTNAQNVEYQGFPAMGFVTEPLLDPALRDWLKMPETIRDGVYVSDVYTLGTGCEELKKNDALLTIDGHSVDAHGRYHHKRYEDISYKHLITTGTVGQTLDFEIWRDGKKQHLSVKLRNFPVENMLIPYYEYNKQGEYIVVGGFILQKLTRKFLGAFGKGWPGRVDPHLYHYYRESAFKPDEKRRDIVILSRVLPAEINLGYQNLKQLVVEKYNGKTITSIQDILDAQKLNPESKFDIIQFENDNPTVVLPRDMLPMANAQISQLYGIEALMHIEK